VKIVFSIQDFPCFMIGNFAFSSLLLCGESAIESHEGMKPLRSEVVA
jgi:hypothetical protein